MPRVWTWFYVINVKKRLIFRSQCDLPGVYISCLYWTDLRLRIYLCTTWLKCALWGISLPSYAVSVVWERQEPLLLNTLFNCNQESVSAVSPPLLNPLHMYMYTLTIDTEWLHVSTEIFTYTVQVASLIIITIISSHRIVKINKSIYELLLYRFYLGLFHVRTQSNSWVYILMNT